MKMNFSIRKRADKKSNRILIKTSKVLILSMVLLFGTLFFLPTHVQADSYTVNPGERKTGTVNIYNDTVKYYFNRDPSVDSCQPKVFISWDEGTLVINGKVYSSGFESILLEVDDTSITLKRNVIDVSYSIEMTVSPHKYSWSAEPSCTESVTRTGTCSVCGKEYTQTTTPLDHDWNSFFTIDKEATCVDGQKSRHCSRCNEKIDITSIPAVSEHYVKRVSLKKATTSADGHMEGFACSGCGQQFTDSTGTNVMEESEYIIPQIEKTYLEEDTFIYDGTEKTPVVVVEDRTGKNLKEGEDYSVNYSDNVEIGKATAKVTFTGNYSGEKNLTFSIKGENQIDPIPDNEWETTGTLSVLNPSKSFTLTFDSTKYCWYAFVVVNYSPEKEYLQVSYDGNTYYIGYQEAIGCGPCNTSKTITITDNSASSGKAGKYGIAKKEFGHQFEYQNTRRTCTEGSKNYKCSREDCNKTMSIPIDPLGHEIEYCDCLPASFTETGCTKSGYICMRCRSYFTDETGEQQEYVIYNVPCIDKKSIKLCGESFEYNGKPIEPEFQNILDTKESILDKGTDYDVRYENNTNKGTAKAIVQFKGNYTGTAEKNFVIEPQSVNDDNIDISFSPSSLIYNGQIQKPDVLVKDNYGNVLNKDTDYNVIYKDNIKAGTAKVIIQFEGNYTGTASKEFTIKPQPVNDDIIDISVSPSSFFYSYRQEQKPVITVKDNEGKMLKDETDYNVKFEDNINAGTAKAIVQFEGNYTGTLTKEFMIKPQPVNDDNVILSQTSFTYNGFIQEPSVTIRGNRGEIIPSTDYLLANSGGKAVGEYTVTAMFRNNYSGNVVKSYTINPKGTKIRKLKAAKKAFSVKWKPQKTQTTGYEIRYSKKKNFSNSKIKTIKKKRTVKTTIRKLSKNTVYYVQIRTYMETNSGIFYSKWSKTEKVKTR